MNTEVDELVKWFTTISEEFYNQVKHKDVLLTYLQNPDDESVIGELLGDEVVPDLIRDLELPEHVRKLSESLGFSIDSKRPYKTTFGGWSQETPLTAALQLFFWDYFFLLRDPEANIEELLNHVKDWLGGERIINQTIFLASPVNEKIILSKTEGEGGVSIGLSPTKELKAISPSKSVWSSPIDSLMWFASLDNGDQSFADIYPLEKELRPWQSKTYGFFPNTQLEVTHHLPARRFHTECASFYRQDKTNFIFQAYNICKAVMVMFHLIGVPSEVQEHTFHWDTAWDPIQPSPVLIKSQDSEKEEIEKIFEQKQNWMDYDPRQINYMHLQTLWTRYCDVLLRLKEVTPLHIACSQLAESLKIGDSGDIFFKLIVGIESLYGESSELSYRLALYVSALYPPDIREQKFRLFKNLYRLRSAIVHGTDHVEKEKRKIFRNWDHLSTLQDIINETRNFLIFGILSFMELIHELPSGQKNIKGAIISLLESQILSNNSMPLLKELYEWFYTWTSVKEAYK